MAKFRYRGETREGKEITDTIEAKDRFDVYSIAREQGHTVSEVTEITGFDWKGRLNISKINAALSRVKEDELVMVTRNLGSMLNAGLTVTRSLSVIQRQSKNPKLKQTLSDIVDRINRGGAFYEALGNHPKVFNDLFVAMVKAGEESGNLATALSTLAIQMEKASNLKKKVKGAMIYPSIVMIVMTVIAVLMMTFVMPRITTVFKGMNKELPATTEVLIVVSDFMAGNVVLVFAILFGSIAGIIYFFRTQIGKKVSSWTVVRLPVIGTLAKETNAARTARTLSSLLESGVDVIRSIEITEEVLQNIYYKRIMREAARRVEKGTALSETFIEHNKLYPILVGEMILVGEETGQIAGMMKEMAIFYENEVERKTKDLSTIIEPLLMVVIGASVGFFALALIAPIYSISDGIG